MTFVRSFNVVASAATTLVTTLVPNDEKRCRICDEMSKGTIQI